jgi:hypothetical protein
MKRILVLGETSSLFKKLEFRHEPTEFEFVYSSEIKWRLGAWVEQIDKFDLCIDFAHSRVDPNLNLLGTRILAEQFGHKMVYISSLSAHCDSRSVYAQNKFACEQIVISSLGSVISLGIFLDSEVNGIYKFLVKTPFSKYTRIFPFSGPLLPVTQTSELETLLNEICSKGIEEYPKKHHLYSSQISISQILNMNQFSWEKKLNLFLDKVFLIFLNHSHRFLGGKDNLMDRILTIVSTTENFEIG